MKELFFYLRKNKGLVFTLITLTIALFIQTGYVKRLQDDITSIKTSGYQEAFFDLSSSLYNIDVLLSKALVTKDAYQLDQIANQLKIETACAKMCMGNLPKKDINIETSQKFLSQISDFATTLKQNPHSYHILKELSFYADKLSTSLMDTENKFLTGEMNFNNIFSASSDDKKINSYFENIELQFSDYPDIIYDGSYSDHLKTLNSPANSIIIDNETAMNKALDFLDFENIKKLNKSSDSSENSGIYGFFEDNITIDVTKTDGNIVYYNNSREINDDRISYESAIKKATQFLKSKGYESLTPEFYEKADNIITISFFPKINDITVYSDAIKIKVACDNGDIIGSDFSKYIENHKKRTDLTPVIDINEGKINLNKNFSISSQRLCILPIYKGKEVLCYEYSGKLESKDFLCYVNATNGETEKIFLIIKDKNKILAI